MTPRHVQISESGKDGLTVVDVQSNEIFSVKADALAGNGWDVPESPGGVKSPITLWVIEQSHGGLRLQDQELGHEYWVSGTGLKGSGCTPRKIPENS